MSYVVGLIQPNGDRVFMGQHGPTEFCHAMRFEHIEAAATAFRMNAPAGLPVITDHNTASAWRAARHDVTRANIDSMIETACCIWEAILEARAGAEQIAESFERHGTATIRMAVADMVADLDADYQIAEAAGYDLPFDWEFVPAWLALNVDWTDGSTPTVAPVRRIPEMPRAHADASQAASELSVEVSYARRDDLGNIETCHDEPATADRVAVYIRNPEALHVADWTWSDVVDGAHFYHSRPDAERAAIAYAKELAKTLQCAMWRRPMPAPAAPAIKSTESALRDASMLAGALSIVNDALAASEAVAGIVEMSQSNGFLCVVKGGQRFEVTVSLI